jgi:hypothetical protein
MAAPRNQLDKVLRVTARDLDAVGARWTLIGGLAVSARAEPRTTRDAMKLLARDDRRRPQDADDLRELLLVARARDLARAKRSVRLIEARGFARRRNLSSALARAVRQIARSRPAQ